MTSGSVLEQIGYKPMKNNLYYMRMSSHSEDLVIREANDDDFMIILTKAEIMEIYDFVVKEQAK